MLRLRPYKSCDAKYIVSWMKDEISFRKWCADRYEYYPITGEDMNQYYDQFKEDDILYQIICRQFIVINLLVLSKFQ